jgi:hypothetical protein
MAERPHGCFSPFIRGSALPSVGLTVRVLPSTGLGKNMWAVDARRYELAFAVHQARTKFLQRVLVELPIHATTNALF